MAVTPSGHSSLVLDNLRALIAASSTFRTFTSTSTTAAAAARVYTVRNETYTLPCAVVDWVSSNNTTIAAGTVERRDTLVFWLIKATGTASDTDEAWTLMNTAGAVVAEMQALAGTGGYLNVLEINTNVGRPERDRIEGVGDHYSMSYTVEVGS